jgi:hypothetical protein
MLDIPNMPEGYGLIMTAKGNYNILVQKHNKYIKTKEGKPKYFKTPERAVEYARKHAELKLNYAQQVPGWI